MERLTRKQAAVIGAFTGICAGPFVDIQEYASKKLGRPIFTHEFGSKEVAAEIKNAARIDFASLAAQ